MREVGSREDLVNDALVDLALGTHGPVPVVLLLAVGEVANGRVDEDISRAGVEIIAALHVALGQDGEVRNAADVLHGPVEAGVVQEEGVEGGEERAALAAEGHVGDAEVAERRHAGVGGDGGDLGHVQVCPHLVPLEKLG